MKFLRQVDSSVIEPNIIDACIVPDDDSIIDYIFQFPGFFKLRKGMICNN